MLKRHNNEGDAIIKPYKPYRSLSKLENKTYCRRCSSANIIYSMTDTIDLGHIIFKRKTNEIIPNTRMEWYRCNNCGFIIPMLLQLKLDFLDNFADFMQVIKSYGMSRLYAIRLRKKIKREINSIYGYNKKTGDWKLKDISSRDYDQLFSL